MSDPASSVEEPRRGQIVFRNTALNVAGQALPLAVGVVTLPFIIRGLGADRAGILFIVWIVVGYAGLLDLGFSVGVTRAVASALATGDGRSIASVGATAVTAQIVLGLVAAGVLMFATPSIVEHFLNIPAGLEAETRSTFYVIAASLPAVLVSGSLRGMLEAKQRFDLVNAVSLPAGAGNFLLPLVATFLAWDLVGVAGLLGASRLVVAGAYGIMCLGEFPGLRESGRFSREEFRKLLRFGGWVSLSAAIAPLLLYTDRFVIGALLTLPMLTAYTVPFEVVYRLEIISGGLMRSLFPVLSSFGAANHKEASRLYLRAVKLLLIFVGPLYLVLISVADVLLIAWLGPDLGSRAAPVARILLVGELFAMLAPVPGSLLIARGRPELLARTYLLYVPVNLLLVWQLVDQWGIAGAATSYAIRGFVETTVLILLSLAVLGERPGRWIQEGRLEHAVGLILALSVVVVLGQTVESLYGEALLLVVAVGVFGVIAWRWVLAPDERSLVLAITRLRPLAPAGERSSQ